MRVHDALAALARRDASVPVPRFALGVALLEE
jgi:hypothetical protein